jgi:hypothetical protein
MFFADADGAADGAPAGEAIAGVGGTPPPCGSWDVPATA